MLVVENTLGSAILGINGCMGKCRRNAALETEARGHHVKLCEGYHRCNIDLGGR